MEKEVQERFERIERILEKQTAETDKMLDAAGKLIVVGRNCLDSIRELREAQREALKELRDAQAATDEKLNILIDTVDRIIRRRNGDGPK